MSLPLSGLTVVEIGTSVAGPVGCQILADLGADVIKVENANGGDDARMWGPPFVNGSGAVFYAVNRNKNSVAVDLHDDDQRAKLRRFIIEKADIVLQNSRPGNMARYNLDARSLRSDKPSLIYCNLSGFGAFGPLQKTPGYDPLIQAFSGIMSVTGHAGQEPVRVGPAIVDQGTGMWAAIGILAALYQRQVTGNGCEVDTSLFETGLAWMIVQIAAFSASGQVPRPAGSENPSIAPYKLYRAKDAWIVIAAGNDNLFRRLALALEHPEWSDAPEFISNAARVANRSNLNSMIAEVVQEYERDKLLAVLDEAGVPAAPLLNTEEIMRHAQTKASGMIQSLPEGGIQTVGIPLQFDGVRPPFRSGAPDLGNHTSVIMGNSAASISKT